MGTLLSDSTIGIMGRNKKTYSIYLPDRAYSNDNASVPVDSLLHEFAQTPLAGECFRHFYTRWYFFFLAWMTTFILQD